MRYEEMAGILLREARQAGLRTFDTHSTLDTAELRRTFSVCCIPEGWAKETSLWAELTFEWDSVLTAYSVAGTSAMCSIYHHPGEECSHLEAWPHPVAILEAIFSLPYDRLAVLPVGVRLARLGNRLRDLCLEAGLDGTIDTVSFTVSMEEGSLRAIGGDLSSAWAMEGDVLEDSDLLAERVREICRQVHQALLSLGQALLEPEEGQTGGSSARGRRR